jgi:hypothetical protein
MLDSMDSLNVFSGARGGPLPFLLLDGHESRFQLPFMQRLDDEERKWKVCIGVQNGAAHWQVGDSKQHNGRWKMATTSDKTEFFRPAHVVLACNNPWLQRTTTHQSS